MNKPYRTSERVPIMEGSALAHELNNDLTIIVGECDLLANLLEEEADAWARVQVIKTAAKRMAERISARPSPAAVTQHDPR